MAMVMIGVMVLLLCVLLVKWNDLRYRRKGLPAGTLGWPVFGETIEFLKQGPDFMKQHASRYGSFFTSHLLGSPTIVSVDPDMNRYILMNEGKGMVPGYPKSMLDILGKHNIAAVHGSTHKYIRGALLSLVSTSIIKDHLLSKIDHFMRSHLTTHWGCGTNNVFVIVDIQQKTKEMALLSALSQILGTQSELIQSEFMPEFFKLVSGTISLPINLPGTSYRRGFQARRNIVRILERMIKQRRNSEESHHDMLQMMMNGGGGEDKHYELSDEQIIDQMITIVYSGYETISTTTMMSVKFLHDHPHVLEELRKEHDEIRAKKRPEDPITWEDYKQMLFTRAVILETSRLATVVNGILRKATKDIELNGYRIPKGWRIYVYLREINYDTSMYPDPLTYNPWRWMQDGEQKKNKNLEYQNNFLLFGGGTRLCPGKELGIAEISTFLHYFVTQYRWEEVGGDKLLKFPRVYAPNGLHMKVSSY